MYRIIEDVTFKIMCANKKSLSILYVLVCCAVFMVCGPKELTREEAARLIIDHAGYPKPLEYKFQTIDPVTARLALHSNLEEEGYIQVIQVQELKDVGKPLIVLTEKAGSYLLATTKEEAALDVVAVKLADEYFIEVTGIKLSGDGRTAHVEYKTTITNLTPFTKLLPRKLEARTMLNQVSFALFDDGWRISKE